MFIKLFQKSLVFLKSQRFTLLSCLRFPFDKMFHSVSWRACYWSVPIRLVDSKQLSDFCCYELFERKKKGHMLNTVWTEIDCRCIVWPHKAIKSSMKIINPFVRLKRKDNKSIHCFWSHCINLTYGIRKNKKWLNWIKFLHKVS